MSAHGAGGGIGGGGAAGETDPTKLLSMHGAPGDEGDEDPTELVLDKAHTASGSKTKTPKKHKQFLFNGSQSPRSTPVDRAGLNRIVGYKPGVWEWRKDAMIAKDLMEFKVPLLQARLELLNDARRRFELTVDEKRLALEVTTNFVQQGKSAKDIYHKLKDINPKLPEFLINLLEIEFTQGKPGALSQVPRFISDLSDIKFEQWFRQHDYETSRILHVLNSAMFYNDCSIKKEADNSGFKMTRAIDDKGNTETLYSVKVEHNKDKANKSKMHKVIFTLEDNSSQSVIALADFMSMNRQGNNNFITLTSVGDPVAFSLLLTQLVCVHNMYVVLPPGVITEFHEELDKLVSEGYPQTQVDQIRAHTQQCIDFATVANYVTPKKINPWSQQAKSKVSYKEIKDQLALLAANSDALYQTPTPPVPPRSGGSSPGPGPSI